MMLSLNWRLDCETAARSFGRTNDGYSRPVPCMRAAYHPITIQTDGKRMVEMTSTNMNTLLEATRLTQAGHLPEAMSLLRGLTSANMPHAAQSGSWATMRETPR